MKKILTLIHGFCMALADSVPGVSGGTVAFLLGFYDNFIGALDSMISGTREERKKALLYLMKLGAGWVVGFTIAVLILANLFESHIYQVSSLFLGFTFFAIPLVLFEEKECLGKSKSRAFFILIGTALVAVITYLNSIGNGSSFDISDPGIGTFAYVFIVGAIAICAMILPGISGSTLLLIFGIYLPIITGIKDLLHMDFHAFPVLFAFGLGVITGVICIIKIIKNSLENHRAATVYLIIGLMIGSLYAITMGPTTLDNPQDAMALKTFSPLFFIIGAVVIYGMQLFKKLSSPTAVVTE